MNKPSPPKPLLRFFHWFCHPELHPFIEGDLLELYEERVEEQGKRRANIRFALDVLLLFRPSIIRPFQQPQSVNHTAMFRHYFKIGWRNIIKYKAFSFINVFGLAVAMSVSMFIILIFAYKKGYAHFHAEKDIIYRILTKPADHRRPYATTPAPLAEELKTGSPIIKEVTRLRKGFGGDAVYNQNYAELKGYFTDPAFFRIFSYELEEGDRRSALVEPNTMIITSLIAEQLLGQAAPIGKTIDFSDRGIDMFTEEGHTPVPWGIYTVTGVLAKQRHKTHLQFDVLVSSSSLPRLHAQNKIYDASIAWGDYSKSYTYVQVRDQVGEEQLNSTLAHLSALQYKGDERLKNSVFTAQALTAITPGPVISNDTLIGLPMFAYYILAGLALVVMLSACLNYTNLSIARTLTRSKEIGVRKVNGARRKDLTFQFLGESVITAFLALILAVGILFLIRSAFLNLWVNQHLNFDMQASLPVFIIFIGLALLTGLIAGAFPALRLSGFRPIKALKKQSERSVGGLALRKVLIITQFVISLLFIVTSIVGFNQFKHFMAYEYSFDAHNVVNINLQSNDYQLVKNALQDVPGVTEISACAYLPGGGRNDGITLKPPGEEGIQVIDLSVDEGFINTLDIELMVGSNLSNEGANASESILVNKEMARVFGYESAIDIIGESFETANGQSLTVVGVVEDFTFSLLFVRQIIRPVILRNEPEKFHFVNVKLAGIDKMGAIAQLKEKWKTVDPIHPFKYEFFDDELAGYNKGIFDLVSVIGFFAFLAISIACLGLLGMTIYATERRTKEISIRKVLGATTINVTYLLSREFLMLLSISVIIAAPLSYFFNRFWLDFLVVRVEFGLSTILLGSVLLLLLGLLTISPQTFLVSRRNPVDSLRNE